ncbi:hypothetical protein GDO81_007238 [Engystomops pustulosus]|uniref:Uncharacterized protein n=1 Tax=Engystomops pustulosus TaxID=76066 RepID=A0AAV7C5N5_ENGPU|nr:hypothetical protein GDO81_007238 [Engystomops pustulosus]
MYFLIPAYYKSIELFLRGEYDLPKISRGCAIQVQLSNTSVGMNYRTTLGWRISYVCSTRAENHILNVYLCCTCYQYLNNGYELGASNTWGHVTC